MRKHRWSKVGYNKNTKERGSRSGGEGWRLHNQRAKLTFRHTGLAAAHPAVLNVIPPFTAVTQGHTDRQI